MNHKALSTDDLHEIQELVKMVALEKFKLNEFKDNTLLIPERKRLFNFGESDRQYIVRQQEAVVMILQNALNAHVLRKLAKLGYTADDKVSLDTKTGIIKEV